MASVNQQYDYLKNKWIDRHRDIKENLLQKHKDSFDWVSKNFSPKQLALGSLGSLILLTAPGTSALPKPNLLLSDQSQGKTIDPIDKNVFVISNLSKVLPKEVVPLSVKEEADAISILERDYGIKITAEMSGKRLERNYGYIGQEQHLARYPGDTMGNHFSSKEEANELSKYGMAPGLGAWGYFSRSKAEFNDTDKQREKYYLAIQTFLAPGFMENVSEYSKFFKYRKMLVVNPNNGRAIVAVIGDAGPAVWTNKHLGGSPEVMRYLERVDGSQKGPVLYFFIDDSNDTIPLGPVELK